MDENGSEDEQLRRFRKEATELLGAEQDTVHTDRPESEETPGAEEEQEAPDNSDGGTDQQK